MQAAPSMALRQTAGGRVPPALPLTKEDLSLRVQRFWHRLQLRRRFAQVDELDVRPPQRRHLAPLPRVSSVDRVQPEPRRQYPVESSRCAAPLNVAKDRRPRLLAGALLDLALEPVGDAAEGDVAEL